MTAALFIALALAAPAPKDAGTGADWPQWRGPHRDGKSTETGLVIPKSGLPLAWTNKDIGIGYGQTAVVGDRLYLVGGSDNKSGSPEALHCLALADGKELWKLDLGTSPGKFSEGWGGGPRSTPTVVDGHVYALGATGELVCATIDGKKIWSKSLVKDFNGNIPQWGYSESPLVDDGRVVVTPGSGTGMIALDAKTGKTIWACKDFDDGAGYSSIMPMMLGGKKLYIQQTMKSALGVFADSGKLAFKTGEIARRTAVIPTPIVSGDYVFFTAGYGAGSECYLLSLAGDKVNAKKIYTNLKTLQNHHGGVIELGDNVFGHSDSGGWTMLPFKKESPEALWQNGKFGKGSVTFADGYFFCYQEKDGEIVVVKATPEKWDEVSRFKIPATSSKRPKSGKVWPHPVVARGKLFLRDFELLHVYDLKAKS